VEGAVSMDARLQPGFHSLPQAQSRRVSCSQPPPAAGLGSLVAISPEGGLACNFSQLCATCDRGFGTGQPPADWPRSCTLAAQEGRPVCRAPHHA